jgi:hypothetical protein
MNNSTKIIELVESYCRLIESIDAIGEQELEQLASLLSGLQNAVEGLERSRQPLPGQLAAVDLDARFELFSHLHSMLGESDRYWLEYDNPAHSAQMSGSLADDLTDIYCELKPGLSLLEQEPESALNSWRQGFHLHWGEHLVDAARHLYRLRREEMAGQLTASTG